MRITIENDEGQKAEFCAWDNFETRILKLSCSQCGCDDDVILTDKQNKVLREFLYGDREPKK